MAKKILFQRVIIIILLFNAIASIAQVDTYKPVSGQEGKDVIWVPTTQVLVDKMLDMAQVKPTDYLMDLGSGDGRLVISAAKRGARAVGIEYNPDMVKLSKQNAAKAGVSDKAKFIEADLFKTDLSKASVVTLFLLTNLNLRLRPTLLELKPGTRIVSNTFNMGDWEPDKKETVTKGCESGFCTALLWIVPAKVAGKWKTDQGNLTLSQKYQNISGTLNSGSITEGHMNGVEITFKVNGNSYKGTVTGNQINGSVTTATGTRKWNAVLQ